MAVHYTEVLATAAKTQLQMAAGATRRPFRWAHSQIGNRRLLFRKLDRKRFRQVLFSLPRYLRELRHLHRPRDVYQWTYYKLPYLFPLAPFPMRINLELTNECNLGCKHCPRSVMGRPLGFMPVELFHKITDEVAHYPGALIKVVGLGEPALHPQINDLMKLIGGRRIPSIVYTNGELFKACTVEQILGWDVQTIVVSVDGLDAIDGTAGSPRSAMARTAVS